MHMTTLGWRCHLNTIRRLTYGQKRATGDEASLKSDQPPFSFDPYHLWRAAQATYATVITAFRVKAIIITFTSECFVPRTICRTCQNNNFTSLLLFFKLCLHKQHLGTSFISLQVPHTSVHQILGTSFHLRAEFTHLLRTPASFFFFLTAAAMFMSI